MTGAIIEATDLVKRFGPSPALDGASFAAAAGEMIAVMGPSGSGKSTLLHCLAGVLVPDAGRVYFDGRRLDNLSAGDRAAIRRTSLGFVFQFGQLVPELPARENVMLPLVLGGMRRRAARAEADVWLDRVGLPGSATACRASCRAARGSASPSLARSCTGPSSCSPTSRPARSTRWPARP